MRDLRCHLGIHSYKWEWGKHPPNVVIRVPGYLSTLEGWYGTCRRCSAVKVADRRV
jgi:hypothetical protein